MEKIEIENSVKISKIQESLVLPGEEQKKIEENPINDIAPLPEKKEEAKNVSLNVMLILVGFLGLIFFIIALSVNFSNKKSKEEANQKGLRSLRVVPTTNNRYQINGNINEEVVRNLVSKGIMKNPAVYKTVNVFGGLKIRKLVQPDMSKSLISPKKITEPKKENKTNYLQKNLSVQIQKKITI